MTNINWTETLSPPEGGWSRLQARIAEQEHRQKLELRLWAAVSAAMIGAVVFTTSFNDLPLPSPPSGKVVVENAQVVEREGTPEGIHYYWVFNDR